MRDRLQLSPEQEDALGEVANVMIGHAATALAKLTGARVNMEIPTIRVTSWREGLLAAGQGSGIVAGVRTRMLGEVAGEVYVTFDRESAFAVADAVRGLPRHHTRYMSGATASALVEVGNIVAGACLAAFYEFIHISLVHSVPEFIYDLPDALGAAREHAPTGPVLYAQVTLEAPEIDLRANLTLFFTVESLSALLDALETSQP